MRKLAANHDHLISHVPFPSACVAWPTTADYGQAAEAGSRGGTEANHPVTPSAARSQPGLHSLPLVPYRGRISSWSLSSAGIADISGL